MVVQSLAIVPDAQDWPRSYRCVNLLLKEGSRILWAQAPFTAMSMTGKRIVLERGVFLVTEWPSGVGPDWPALAERRFGVEVLRLDAVEDFEGLPLHPLRIAMYGGGGAPYNHARIFADLGFRVEWIMAQEIRRGRLAEFDVFGMPGGGWSAMNGQLDPLGREGCHAISEFVRSGGMYFGSCAGSFDAAIVSDSFLSVCPQQRELQLVNAAVWNRDDTDFVGLRSPGVGVLESRNLCPNHPIMFGMPERFRITHYNGPFFEARPGAVDGASDMVGLAAVAGVTDDFTAAEDFLRLPGSGQDAGSTLVTQAAQQGRYNVVAGYNGLGRVVLFGSHPEFGYNLAMDRWDVPARMLANAAFWQSAFVTGPRPAERKVFPGTSTSYPVGAGLRAVGACLTAIHGRIEVLKAKSEGSLPSWLGQDVAMSTFGLSGEEIWRRNLATFADVGREIAGTIDRTEELVQEAGRVASALRVVGRPRAAGIAEALDGARLGLEEAIHFRVPDEWHQDFGYEGVLQMLHRTELALATAERNLELIFEPVANPYQYVDSSPYQLVAGSYLAALGVFANAWFLLQMQELELSDLVFRGRAVLAVG